jgi:hypothetical protein
MLVMVTVALFAMQGACNNARIRQRHAYGLADPGLDFIICHFHRPFGSGKNVRDLTLYASWAPRLNFWNELATSGMAGPQI